MGRIGTSLFSMGALLLFLPLQASAQSSSGQAVTLWITAPGVYRLQNPTARATPLGEVETALRTALQASAQPTRLAVRAYQGVAGYDYLMVKNAACRAGTERIEFAGELPVEATDTAQAPQGWTGEEVVSRPCPSDAGIPDRPNPQR